MNMILPLAGLLLLQAFEPQEKKDSPLEKFKVEFKLAIEERNGEHVFTLEGTTDLPQETILKARVYAVSVVEDYSINGTGTREDEEALVWGEDPEALQPGSRNFQPADGKFRVEVYRFARKPWALRYRGRVHYVAELQNEDVLKFLGNQEFSWAADLTTGTREDFTEQLRVRAKEALNDLVTIKALLDELEVSYKKNSVVYEAAEWKAWTEKWFPKVEKIRERNKHRYELWQVWMERQAKMGIDSLCESMRRMAVACGDHLSGKSKEDPGDFKELVAHWEDVINRVGVDPPLDLPRLKPIVAAYERGLAGVRAWLAKPEEDPSVARSRTRRECSIALLRMAPLVETRKRAYNHVNELSLRFRRLLEVLAAGADPEKVRALLREHDAAMSAFKDYAGLVRKK